jgi:hypothetical protein
MSMASPTYSSGVEEHFARTAVPLRAEVRQLAALHNLHKRDCLEDSHIDRTDR